MSNTRTPCHARVLRRLLFPLFPTVSEMFGREPLCLKVPEIDFCHVVGASEGGSKETADCKCKNFCHSGCVLLSAQENGFRQNAAFWRHTHSLPRTHTHLDLCVFNTITSGVSSAEQHVFLSSRSDLSMLIPPLTTALPEEDGVW